MSDLEEYSYCILKNKGKNVNDKGKSMLCAEVVLLSVVHELFPACNERSRTDTVYLETIQQTDSNFCLVNPIQFKLIFLCLFHFGETDCIL